MTKDDLIPRLTRVFHLLTKQLFKLTTKDLMQLLKSKEMEEFFKSLAILEKDHLSEDESYFAHQIKEILKWQATLPFAVINIKRDFIQVYAKSSLVDRGYYKDKVMYNQSKKTITMLEEFFRILDASISTNKMLPIEAFAQHLGLTLNDLVRHLERVNWSDLHPEIVKEIDNKPFELPIHIEKDFFQYYHSSDRPTQLEIQERALQGIRHEHGEKMNTFFAWLDLTDSTENIQFTQLVKEASLHPQELIHYLDRINWK